ADALAECVPVALRTAIDEYPLDRRNHCADACDLRLRLSSAPDHPERCRAFASEVLRRYRAGRAGAQASQIVGFDQRNELRSVDSEEGDDERGSVTGRSVC